MAYSETERRKHMHNAEVEVDWHESGQTFWAHTIAVVSLYGSKYLKMLVPAQVGLELPWKCGIWQFLCIPLSLVVGEIRPGKAFVAVEFSMNS